MSFLFGKKKTPAGNFFLDFYSAGFLVLGCIVVVFDRVSDELGSFDRRAVAGEQADAGSID